MRKTSLLVITWMIGAVLAVGLALQGVALVDGQFVENRPNAMSQSAVKAEIRRLAAISTTTATTVAPGTSSATAGAGASTTFAESTTTTAASTTTLAPPVASNLALGSAGRPRIATTTTTRTAAAAPPALVAPPSLPPETTQPTSSTTSPVTQALPPEVPTTVRASTMHVFSTAGGSIDVSFDGSSVALGAVKPAADYVVEIRDSGPSTITVRFTNEIFRKTIRVTIYDGELVHSITVQRLDS